MANFFSSPIKWSQENPLKCAAGVAGVAATGYLLSKAGLLAPIVSVICSIFGSLIGSIGGVLLIAAVGFYLWKQQNSVGDSQQNTAPASTTASAS